MLQKSMELLILLEQLLKRHIPERYANRFSQPSNTPPVANV